MEAREKIQKARAGLILDHPFFGALALKLALNEDITCKTLWTDGTKLGYNPDFVTSLSLDEVKGCLGHEVMHIACAHHARRQSRNKQRWNKAGDYAINDLLLEAGFTLTKNALTGLGSRDESAESIYNKLPDDGNDQGQGKSQDNEEGTGDPDPGGNGEVRDAPGKDGQPASQAELDQAEAEAKIAVQQAATIAKSWGKLPSGIQRLVDELLKPHIPWREVLRRFIDQCVRNDYTWTRPSKRYMAAGLYLPSLYSEEMRPIAVAIDTSGSISQEELDQFAGELDSIIHDVRTSATVIYCDAEIAGVEEFTPDDELKLEPVGGGGTDFRPPFTEVEARQLDPACLIYLTDGDCRRFPDAPAYPVMWGKTGTCPFNPPFGEVMEIEL